jgi:hypothetical protein
MSGLPTHLRPADCKMFATTSFRTRFECALNEGAIGRWIVRQRPGTFPTRTLGNPLLLK